MASSNGTTYFIFYLKVTLNLKTGRVLDIVAEHQRNNELCRYEITKKLCIMMEENYNTSIDYAY